MLRENKEHRVLALKDFEDKDFEDVIKRPAFCSKDFHERRVLKFYCKVCQVPACKNCVTLEHGKHDVEPMEKISTAVRNSITSELEVAERSSSTISKFIRELEERNNFLESNSQIIKQQIQETVKTLIQTLQQQEGQLITEVETQTKEAQDMLMKDKGEYQDQLRKTEETISQVTRLLKRSTGAELVRTKTSVDELFQQLRQPRDIPQKRKVPTIVFRKNQEISRLRKVEIGRLYITTTEANRCSLEGFAETTVGLESQFQVITRNSEGQQCYCPGDNVAVKIVSVQNGKAAADTKIVDQTYIFGSYTVSFIPIETGQHFVTVHVNEEILNESPQIQVKERSFKPVMFIGKESIDDKHLDHPWGVTVSDSNEIFVTDMKNNRILVFTEKGHFVRSFGQNLVNEPTGISIDKKGRILVVNSGDNKILHFNQNGEYLRTVTSDGLLKYPRGICLDSQGNVVVCDSGNKCVRFLSAEGNNFKTIGKGRLEMPYDCVCYGDKIFVSDREAHLVKVYNSTGKFLYEFGRYHPTGLAVDKTGHLLVCCGDMHRVQVFTLDGKFVTRFGEHGAEELGQIERPTSVAILKSGRIVVCEFGNNRLQLFA